MRLCRRRGSTATSVRAIFFNVVHEGGKERLRDERLGWMMTLSRRASCSRGLGSPRAVSLPVVRLLLSSQIECDQIQKHPATPAPPSAVTQRLRVWIEHLVEAYAVCELLGAAASVVAGTGTVSSQKPGAFGDRTRGLVPSAPAGQSCSRPDRVGHLVRLPWVL